MKLTKTFMFFGKDGKYTFGYPFQDRGFEGSVDSVLKKAVKKHPQFSSVFKLLIPSGIPFFYDSVLNKFRIVAAKDIDFSLMDEYINKYFHQFKNVTIIDQFCRDNKLSDFDLPKTQTELTLKIADFLAENGLDV